MARARPAPATAATPQPSRPPTNNPQEAQTAHTAANTSRTRTRTVDMQAASPTPPLTPAAPPHREDPAMTATAPAPVQAVPLDGFAVDLLLSAMRTRYAALTDPEGGWRSDAHRQVAQHMAAGVKLCLDDLERALRQAQAR